MTDRWVRDTGLVFSLLFLVLGYRGNKAFLLVAGVLLAILLIRPSLLSPLAYCWLKVAERLGSVVNKVFLGLVFFLVITPIGYLRRFFVGDARSFALDRKRRTAFVDRNMRYAKGDLEKPY